MSSKCQVLWAAFTLVLASACSSPSKQPGKVVVSSVTEPKLLDPVSFRPGTAELEARSLPILDSVVSTLQDNPNILLVEVQSHTDERGDDDANLKLSQQRAEVVMKYLVDKGVAPARLTANGYGETQPLDPAHTPEAWAKNQRIAFLILKRTD